MEHTKGPWEVGNWGGDNGYVVRGDGEQIVCEANRALDESKTNARLISAAPELLEACKMALEDLTGPVTSQGIKIRFETLDKLREALAKAEGR